MSDDIPPDIGSPIPDPFKIVQQTIFFVSAGAGNLKTRTMLTVRAKAARRGQPSIIAAPTNDLVGEMIEFLNEEFEKKHLQRVPIYEITSSKRTQYRKSFGLVSKRIVDFIEKFGGIGGSLLGRGILVFITHEGLHRIPKLPPETKLFNLYIDEEPETLLTRKPLKLRYSHRILSDFLDINPVPTTLAERLIRGEPPPEFTTYPDEHNIYDSEGKLIQRKRDRRSDKEWLNTYGLICLDPASSESQKEVARKKIGELLIKQKAWEEWGKNSDTFRLTADTKSYYLLTPKPDVKQDDPLRWVKLRDDGKERDEVYKLLEPIPRWSIQDCKMFVKMSDYNALTIPPDSKSPEARTRGQVSIIGFRRPDILQAFNSVTILSAFFEHTMTYIIWKQLGVTFKRSDEIDITDPKTQLGKRKLNIYWLYEDGWSKYIRDSIPGGIEKVLELIKASGVIEANAKVCVSVNKDDGGPENTGKVRNIFPNAEVMPHNPRGQNKFRHHHQLIFLPALNPYTTDIEWLERVLGIDSNQVRVARTGLEAYQTMMRTNLRDGPKGKHDVDIIVMDKDVAEWLVPHFEPADQVSLFEIDSSGVINRKQKRGPKPKGNALTSTERSRRRRERMRLQKTDQS